MRSLLLLALCTLCSSYKFLAFSPQFATSHVNFMARITDILIDAGHEVVILSPVVQTNLMIGAGTKKARVIEIPQNENGAKIEELFGSNMAKDVWTQHSVMMMKNALTMFDILAKQCQTVLTHPGLLEKLREEKFDAAYVEGMEYCGPVLFHLLGIEKFAITDSLSISDFASIYTDTPAFPSYIPSSFGGTTDKMTFLERIENTFMFTISKIFFPYTLVTGHSVLSQEFTDLPPIVDLIGKCSLVFQNCEPLVDFPKVTSAKMIDIGGITVSSGHVPLNKTWSDIMNLREKTVLVSFGTVAKAYLMPEEYKKTLRNTMRKFPNVTFIWKYEKPEHKISEGIDNLIESTWIPQRDMLHDPRLSAFITHCGQGSTTESIDAGIPLIVIPVLSDQLRNAQQVKRNEIGIIMDKEDLANESILTNAIKEILVNDKYRTTAKKVKNMVLQRPFSMKEIFVKNMEFIVKHGPLRQLDHYGRNLNFFQYYLIDVIAFITFIILFVISIVILLLNLIVKRVARLVLSKRKVD